MEEYSYFGYSTADLNAFERNFCNRQFQQKATLIFVHCFVYCLFTYFAIGNIAKFNTYFYLFFYLNIS